MIGMSTIVSIRELDRQGMSIAEIARLEGVSEPTVRKYIDMDDFSPAVPVKQGRKSILDEFKPQIDAWLEEDRHVKRKQRHSAKRIFNRLREELGYTGGYTTVQKYVRECKERRGTVENQYLDQTWPPGDAQVDFGEAECRIAGKVVTMLYLVVSFPFSNVGLAQLFYGENSECVCQGLKNIFHFIGGIPNRLVFDNATGVGRRVGDKVRTAKTFEAFAAHYGFSYSFCNPYSGHEKGSVEAKVRFIRSNILVPVPSFDDVHAYNKALLPACMALSSKAHYLKNEPECQLFVEDAAALAELPAKPYEVVRYDSAKTDKYGNVKLDGKHWYPTTPAYGERVLHVGFGAFEVSFYDEGGARIATHPRAYGSNVTKENDPASQLVLLCKKPGGWTNSQMRATVPEVLREHVDGLAHKQRRAALCAIDALSSAHGYNLAVDAASVVAGQVGMLTPAALELTCARLATGGQVEYGTKVDLDVYDCVLAKEV
jgi:transposase